MYPSYHFKYRVPRLFFVVLSEALDFNNYWTGRVLHFMEASHRSLDGFKPFYFRIYAGVCLIYAITPFVNANTNWQANKKQSLLLLRIFYLNVPIINSFSIPILLKIKLEEKLFNHRPFQVDLSLLENKDDSIH